MFIVLLFLILAVTCFLTIYMKTKDTLHPIGIMTFIWFFMAGISALYLGEYQVPWCFETIVVIIVSGIICYFFGSPIDRTTNMNVNDQKNERYVNQTFKVLTRIIFWMIFIVIVCNLYKNAYFSFSGGAANMDKKEAAAVFTRVEGRGLNYIISYLPYCALSSIFELTYSPKNKRKWIYNVFVILFSIWYVWTLSYSRGTLLIIVLGCLYIMNSKKKFSLFKIISIGVLVIFGLSFMMMYRLGTESVVFEGATKSASLNSTYNYIAYCYQNLDSLIRSGSPHTLFLSVWQSFYKLFGIYDGSMLMYQQTFIYNAEAYLAPFYHDLGFLGIMIYPGIIAAVLSWMYHISDRNIYGILMLANLQKAVFVVFFGNYFLTTLSIMFPYILTAFICLTASSCKIKMPALRLNNR